jgi:hypothetical protein
MPGERVSMRKIREVLRLRFAQGLSQRAIGVSLGLSTGAVCQSALNIDPLSASKIDPPLRGGLCR